MSGEQLHKKRNSGPVISNSKARGVLVLIGALLLFQVVTFLIGMIGKERPQPDGGTFTETVSNTASASFQFDPNTLSKDSLVLLGFSPKQAQTVVNYRDKGGRFRRREDFARMYAVSAEKYEALKERIVIREKGPARRMKPEPRYENGESRRTPAENASRWRESADAGQGKTAFATADSLYGKKRTQRDSLVLRKPWRCDLNRADSAALVKLYGIGPYFARKILRYKERLGGWFVQAEQLLEIEGMERERFEGFRGKLWIDTTGIRKFSLDTLGRAFMEKHPYIGPYAARGILMYREGRKKEGAVTLQELVRENILPADDAARLKGYIKQ